MNEYKLYVQDTGGKTIDKDAFEADTLRRAPWYQLGSSDKLAQFAVCPRCDNPIQLVGLYQLPPNVKNPFGKHTTSGIHEIGPIDIEARDNCPYFNPRQHNKTDRKARFDGVPRKIVHLLIEQFDRVVYILETQTQVRLSQKVLRGMLERYKAEQGYLYTGATLRNVPWIFAYMSDATPLFAQRVGGNPELVEAIKTHVPEAAINDDGRLLPSAPQGTRGAYLDIEVSFIKHRVVRGSETSGLSESMRLVLSQRRRGVLVDVYRQEIQFDPDGFERLINTRADRAVRNLVKVQLAREVLGDLLKPRA
ncbi:hypothetical protein [Pseudomonas syringae group genomosp. 3]|uniref:Restriction endonuclease n=1 Tax=Pseudomonas syringae group genomosp. 3 TaxID=251701 RepID=A0ABD6V729_9PSED|nr:hypothetical protein [Pseudomonas syringae group genomosp. 3]POD65774.1 hypothetical protein BKM07_21115 [Pseudomonas syringae group genomosp. 3]